MAYQSEQDLFSPVCNSVFKDPVVLSCSHSFCKPCLKRWWTEKQTCECLVCKQMSPQVSTLLKNLREAFLLVRDQGGTAWSEDLCSLHPEKLFYLDLCSKTHWSQLQTHPWSCTGSHRGAPEILKTVTKETENLSKGNFDHTADHIKVEAQHTEKQTNKHFKNEFLQEEEEERITTLREEEKQNDVGV